MNLTITSFIINIFLFSASSVVGQLPGNALPPFTIVHLGDSYSAGNGARDASGNENYVSPRGCYRSPTNWGQLFANSLSDVYAVRYINRACSGAQLSDLTGIQEKTFAPDVPPQINAIDAGVNLVLITMGGNDMGFTTIVSECFTIFLRDATSCREAINDAQAKLPAFKLDLLNALLLIGESLNPGNKNPNAKVVLVSYPHLITATTFVLKDVIVEDEIELSEPLRSLALEFDKIQNEAVNEANAQVGRNFAVFFDKTKELFNGHEPDPSDERRNPARWISEFEGSDPAEWYHLNPEGHTQLSKALSAFTRNQNVQPGSFQNGRNIELAFVVDTTGSMKEEISDVRSNLTLIVGNLAKSSTDFRVAVVSYQDFTVRCPDAYASRVDQDFTNNLTLLKAGIDKLQAFGGCDIPEAVFTGIKTALNLDWRDGASKAMIVIGDAPPVLDSNGAEPISSITTEELVSQSIALDPVAITGADVGALNSNKKMAAIADATGGRIIASSDVVKTINTIINETAAQPFAWIGTIYVGKIGSPILFDASGSYDSAGGILVSYEWDFFGNGNFTLKSNVPKVNYTYTKAFDGAVLLRVTSATNLTGLGSALVIINTEGALSMANTTCERDENGFSIYIDDATGALIDCIVDSLPTEDAPGIEERLDESCSIGFFGILCFFKTTFPRLWGIFTFGK